MTRKTVRKMDHISLSHLINQSFPLGIGLHGYCCFLNIYVQWIRPDFDMLVQFFPGLPHLSVSLANEKSIDIPHHLDYCVVRIWSPFDSAPVPERYFIIKTLPPYSLLITTSAIL